MFFKTREIFTRRPKYIAHLLFEIKVFKWRIISRITSILFVTNVRKRMTRVHLETRSVLYIRKISLTKGHHRSNHTKCTWKRNTYCAYKKKNKVIRFVIVIDFLTQKLLNSHKKMTLISS